MDLLEPQYHLIQAYTWACADAGHIVCGNPSACEKFAGSASRRADAENRASSFDARRAALSRHDQMPDHSWSTTELLVRVEELLRAQPNIDKPFRTIAITTGLARLGERGLPVDWLVRDRIGPGLIRRAILASASVWHRVAVGDLDARDVPELSGWLAAIAEDAPLHYDPEKDLGRVFVNSLSGKASAVGRTWIEEASISDIAAWRVDGYLVSPPALEDMALPGGRAASRWVYDRLTRTYLSEWAPESWAWEAAHLEHPARVAQRAGVAPSILAERTSTPGQIMRASSRFILEDLGEVLPGVGQEEFVEIVAHHLERGQHGEAQTLAEAAFRERSDSPPVRSVFAFCWLPTTPARSREILRETAENSTMSSAVRCVNIAASHLAEGATQAALDALQPLKELSDVAGRSAWLWDPLTLRSRPHVTYLAPAQWADLVESHFSS